MARKATSSPTDIEPVDDIVSGLLGELNKHATSGRAYLQGEHHQNTWGVKIPYPAFQWLIGGSDVLPSQRYFGCSGEKKSFKSTLMTEIGNWYIRRGGIHIPLDTENKTSPTMYDSMTWHNQTDPNRRLFKVCTNITEWQTQITKAVTYAREHGNRPKGQRVPVFITVDSLTGKSTDSAERALRDEGAAGERAFPVGNLQITNFLQQLSLLGTTCNIGWVQHMKVDISQDAGYGGPAFKETGPTAASFANSVHLRVHKGGSFRQECREGAPNPDLPVDGYTIYLNTSTSCLGPDNRKLPVDLCWQYIQDPETGEERQAMWYDWDGAFGLLLYNMKYNDKFKPKLYKAEKDKLDSILHFTEAAAEKVKCEALGLEKADMTTFGRAIMAQPDLVAALQQYLRIKVYPDVQAAEIDFEAGDLAEKKKKGR